MLSSFSCGAPLQIQGNKLKIDENLYQNTINLYHMSFKIFLPFKELHFIIIFRFTGLPYCMCVSAEFRTLFEPSKLGTAPFQDLNASSAQLEAAEVVEAHHH